MARVEKPLPIPLAQYATGDREPTAKNRDRGKLNADLHKKPESLDQQK